MKSAIVIIGEKEYKIEEKKRKANAKWRENFQSKFLEVSELIQGIDGDADLTGGMISTLISDIVRIVGGSVDEMAELVFSYSAELAANREFIEEEAYDSEIMEAFTAVLKLAYPFGSLVEMIGGLANLGQETNETSQNSS